ncbi:MAG: hypothetical protein V1898_04300 [Patescibacteria group bacterium]
MMKKYLLLILIFIFPVVSLASSFNKNNILTTAELTDKNDMTLSRISDFLKTQNGVLANYSTKDIDGKTKSAAQIIYNSCQRYVLNPKFILATLQKEASLVTRKTVTNSLLDQALGFGCPDGGGCSREYAGFANQIDAAANKIRNSYLTDLSAKNSTISGWGIGITKNTGDGTVTPANQATAVLYTYTPWIGYHGGNSSVGGNSLFWDIWKKWFGFNSEINKYPSGSILKSQDSGITYLIKNNKKMAFNSLGALMANYDINKTIAVNENVLDQYDVGASILFPNYTLLQAPSGAMFLYIDGKKKRYHFA